MSETTCPFHDDGHTLNECPSRPIESIKASQHVAHCNRGEHVGHCKYGPNEWCPVFMVIADHDAAHDLGLYKQAYETPYGECFTLPDGDCIGRGCMHDDAARVLAEAKAALADEIAASVEPIGERITFRRVDEDTFWFRWIARYDALERESGETQ